MFKYHGLIKEPSNSSTIDAPGPVSGCSGPSKASAEKAKKWNPELEIAGFSGDSNGVHEISILWDLFGISLWPKWTL